MSEIRELPGVDDRVETGAIRFGDDWPGLFVRGDDSMALLMSLEHAFTLLQRLELSPSEQSQLFRLAELVSTIREDVLL